jgi:hypothetical protein
MRIQRLDQPPDTLGAESVPPPPADTWYLRITLTNPAETFMVYNYTPGNPVKLNVSSGTGRFLDVEAYMIYGPSTSPPPDTYEFLRADHYDTITPATARNLDLTEPTKTVTIELGEASYGSVYGGVIHPYPFTSGGGSLELLGKPMATIPFYDAPLPLDCYTVTPFCPNMNLNLVNVTEASWGLTFATIPVYLWQGGPGTGSLHIGHMPLGQSFNLTAFNASSGIYANASVSMNQDAVPVDLTFTGFTLPTVAFWPSSLPQMNPYDTAEVQILLFGGWGGPASTYVGMNDTCGGSTYSQTGPDGITRHYYSFMAYSGPSCVIHVIAYDCGCSYWGPNSGEGQMTVTISSGGWQW